MDKSAIEAIRDSSGQAAAVTYSSLPESVRESVIAIPNGVALKSIEQFMPGRSRFRGHLETSSIQDFADYVKARPGGHGFIDPAEVIANVIFNLGDATNPGHGDHVATLQLAATPAYLAILSTRGVAFTQRDALDFIEDWAHVITATREDDAGNQQAIPLAHAIAAIRKVKIEAKSSAETTEGNFQQSRSVLESVAASSDAGLPDALEFHITPYQGLSQRFFRLRLSISTSHREPTLRFRIIGLEKAQEEILEEFKDLLTGKIGDAATMTIGTFTL